MKDGCFRSLVRTYSDYSESTVFLNEALQNAGPRDFEKFEGIEGVQNINNHVYKDAPRM